MLLSENFGRSHQRRLISAPHRIRHSYQRNNRFSATYVAEKHPVHSLTASQIVHNVAYRAQLRLRQLKRQRRNQIVHNMRIGFIYPCLSSFLTLFRKSVRAKLGGQLFQSKSSSADISRSLIERNVGVSVRVFKRHEVVAFK